KDPCPLPSDHEIAAKLHTGPGNGHAHLADTTKKARGSPAPVLEDYH
ncbi:MAG: hypothetical protein ACI9IV_002565, partial [Paracoccaceae bacterium]